MRCEGNNNLDTARISIHHLVLISGPVMEWQPRDWLFSLSASTSRWVKSQLRLLSCSANSAVVKKMKKNWPEQVDAEKMIAEEANWTINKINKKAFNKPQNFQLLS